MKRMPRLLAIATLLNFPFASFAAESPSPGEDFNQVMRSMLNQSMTEKKGVILYIQGQEVGGGVVRMVGMDAVELRNQTYGKILVRLDSIHGIAMH